MNVKKILYLIIGVGVAYAAYIAVSLMSLPPVEGLKDRRMNMTIQVKDWHGEYHPFKVGPQNRYWTSSKNIPPEMKWAVILAEDSNFYKHEGIDVKAIKNAIKYDLEKKSFARGASTITQQVAKNLFLSREKTLTRKVKEVVLAKRMEEELTKGRIIELYLNVVELGPMVYGIGHGSRYYFGKPASAMTPRECAFLAAMLPGPRVAYNPYKNLNKVLKRSNMILRLLRNKGVLSAAEYRQAMGQEPNVSGLQRKVDASIEKEEAVFDNASGATVAPEEGLSPATQGVEPATGEPAAAEPAPETEAPAPPVGGAEPVQPVPEETK